MNDQELVDALCDIEDGLSGWEMEFADSLSKWLKENDDLTPKQRAKADEIWKDKG